MKTAKHLFLIGTVLFLLNSFSKVDDRPRFEAPEFSYSETTVPIVFSTSGNLSAPNTNWNNAPGTFSISPSMSALSIDAQTGTLSWDRSLAPGTHQTGRKPLSVDQLKESVSRYFYQKLCRRW
jgi:hypothetical protein